jgi:polyisoprenyl-teichoic acid--peptidoglycan teichoic acid transferase
MVSRKIYFWLRYLIVIAVFIGLVAVAFFSYRSFLFLKKIGVVVKEQVTKKPKETYTAAILGYGGANHQGGYLTDTIIIASINYATKKALLISVPRDLWVKLPTKSKEPFFAKINTVYQLQLFPKTFPDVEVKRYTQNDDNGLIKKTLSDITGLEIDSCAAIDFNAFVTLVDTLGGIDVEVKHSFEDHEYPIEGKQNDLCGKDEDSLEELEKIATESMLLAFPCRFETISFEAGLNHMDGATALKFARSRHASTDGGDFARAMRQQLIIEAITDKLLSPLYFPKITTLMEKLETKIQTDASYQDLARILKAAPESSQYQLKKLVLSVDNFLTSSYSSDGQYILIPKKGIGKWQKIQEKIRQLTAAAN